MSNELSLGQLITDPDAKSDATHIAVAPVVAAEKLYPGQEIGLVKHGIAGISAKKIIGIVDPFLKSPVHPEQKFWMFLFPGTVTGMRHLWIHPEFVEQKPDQPSQDKAESIAYIERLSETYGLDYQEFMAYVNDNVENGEYAIDGGRWEGMSLYENDDFWGHYENVTGKKIDSSDRGGVFSCSC